MWPYFKYSRNEEAVSLVTNLRAERTGRDREGKSSLRHRVQTGSGAHPASYPISTANFIIGG
jgi:hypothetical protein